MTRTTYIQEISKRIGTRNLVWFGQAGCNARPLATVPQLSHAFSVMLPSGLPDGRDVCLERLTGERVRQGGGELRPDLSEVHRDFHRRLYAVLGEPAVAVTHQGSRFFASVYFLRREYVHHLGLFHERQVVFDHKPWVESELARVGIRTVPWSYFATSEPAQLRAVLEDALREGPVVLRVNRSISGKGLTLIRQPEDIPEQMPDGNPDGFVAVAPFLAPSVPLNVGACVFPDGAVSLHGPSLQLIGIPGSARSAFNYCGNDFARVRDLDAPVLEALHEMAVRAGRWLSSVGYVGAFGVDALLYDGKVFLTEINPRFQASSYLSAHLDTALDRPDVYLAHVGAFLGLPAPEPWDLQTVAREQPPMAQIYLRNGQARVRRREAGWTLPDQVECWMMPERGVIVHPEAQLCRVVALHAVTDDGWRLRRGVAAWFAELPGALFDEVDSVGTKQTVQM